jgi:hypothetical protein
MAQIRWITPAGDLGTFAENIEFSKTLEAVNSTASNLTFRVITGELPSGIQLYVNTGLLYGFPNVVTPGDAISRSYRFTIRASNNSGQVADRTFTIKINSLTPPSLTPIAESLGEYYDSDYVNLRLVSVDTNPGLIKQWTVVNGILPPGLELTQDGIIRGFAQAPRSPGAVGTASWDAGKYDEFVWDFEGSSLSRSYKFSVRYFDGIMYAERPYSILIYARSYFRVDNTLISSDSTVFTADKDGYQYPSIVTSPEELLPVRQDRAYAFKFNAYYPNPNVKVLWRITASGPAVFDQGALPVPDTNGNVFPLSPFDDRGFDQANFSLPSGLFLDRETGWLTGTIGATTLFEDDYEFQIQAFVEIPVSETAVSIRPSQTVRFTLKILADIDNFIEWDTPDNLGIIENGRLSTLKISAVANNGKKLTYQIQSGMYSRLPQGLRLLPSGNLAGRTSFDYYSMDRQATLVKLDDGSTTFDSVYRFTVTASSDDGYTYDSKEFTVTVRNVNTKPFENLYVPALLPKRLRDTLRSSINRVSLIGVEDIIYRPDDPYFGVPEDYKFLAVAGLRPNLPAEYIQAMESFHRNKKIEYSGLKKAVALDENLKVKYEIIYLEIKDYNNKSDASVSTSKDGTRKLADYGSVADPVTSVADYGSIADNPISPDDYGIIGTTGAINTSLAYSNTFANMTGEIVDQLGYEYQGALPEWMLSVQPETGSALGFVRAIPLAYANPGFGEQLLFRYISNWTISGYGVTSLINQYTFTADRYRQDRALTVNYNPLTESFTPARTTTFDRIPSVGQVDTGPWVRQDTGTTNNLLSVDFGNDEYIAVGNRSTIISSRSGEVWTAYTQIANLGYKAGLSSRVDAGSTALTFAYGINAAIGDQVLNQGVYSDSFETFITDITYSSRISQNTLGTIPAGAEIEFIKYTGERFSLSLSAPIEANTAVMVFDDISTIERGYNVQIKGIDTANGCIVSSTTSTNVVMSRELTSDIPSGTSILFDDLSGNPANIIVANTTVAAVAGSTVLVFSDTTGISPNAYIRMANIVAGSSVVALNTIIDVSQESLIDLNEGVEIFFTSVITSDALTGDTTINMSSTDRIGVGSVVIGQGAESVTLQTAWWDDVDDEIFTTLSVPTADITGITPYVGMSVTAFGFPLTNTIQAVSTSGDTTSLLVRLGTTSTRYTFAGNPIRSLSIDRTVLTSTDVTYLEVASTTDIFLNDWFTTENIGIENRVRVVDIFANNVIGVNTVSAIADNEIAEFRKPASLTFNSPSIVDPGTTVIAKTSTSLTLSAPLIADLKIGFDNMVEFGLSDVELNYSVYINNRWLIVGTRATVLTKDSADNWTQIQAVPYGDLYSIGYGNSYYIAIGTEGLITRSTNLVDWSNPIATTARGTLRSIDYYDGRWVVVGDRGVILTSTDDGETWLLNNSVTSFNLRTVRHENSQWMIVGQQGTVLISTDGVAWTTYSAGVSDTINDIAYINNQYIAVGSRGTIIDSEDGTLWAKRTSNVTNNLISIANRSSDPVVVGSDGIAIIEADFYTVEWAVRNVSFEMFNYETVTELARQGYRVQAGDQLIFAQQEGFNPADYRGSSFINNGWNAYQEVFDSESEVRNFDSGRFDQLDVVPGYTEHFLDSAVPNRRAGIWQVNINSNNIVVLSFVRQIEINQIVTVINEGVKLVYNPVIQPGNTVPTYTPLTQVLNPSTGATVFDTNSTRFSNPRDEYLSDPETHDKYLKFPHIGVLQ